MTRRARKPPREPEWTNATVSKISVTIAKILVIGRRPACAK